MSVLLWNSKYSMCDGQQCEWHQSISTLYTLVCVHVVLTYVRHTLTMCDWMKERKSVTKTSHINICFSIHRFMTEFFGFFLVCEFVSAGFTCVMCQLWYPKIIEYVHIQCSMLNVPMFNCPHPVSTLLLYTSISSFLYHTNEFGIKWLNGEFYWNVDANF